MCEVRKWEEVWIGTNQGRRGHEYVNADVLGDVISSIKQDILGQGIWEKE